MPRRNVPLVSGNYYHVYNRGVDRQPIYFSDRNYAHFLRKLRKYLCTPSAPDAASVRGNLDDAPVDILAYCLMPNHFHLLVRLRCDDFSDRMAACGKSYTQSINLERGRVGPLFQSRFRARLVEDESYLLHLSRYIHRNPLRARLAPQLTSWPWSSYLEAIGHRQGTLPCVEPVVREVGGAAAYRRFVEEETTIPAGLERYLIR